VNKFFVGNCLESDARIYRQILQKKTCNASTFSGSEKSVRFFLFYVCIAREANPFLVRNERTSLVSWPRGSYLAKSGIVFISFVAFVSAVFVPMVFVLAVFLSVALWGWCMYTNR